MGHRRRPCRSGVWCDHMIDHYTRFSPGGSIRGIPGRWTAPRWPALLALPVVAVLLLTTPVRADDAARIAALDALLAAGQAPRAAAMADSLLASGSVEPRNVWRLQQRLGAALVLAERPAAAVPVLEDALRTAPEDPALHLNLGRALRAMGQGGRAVAEYEVAIRLAPDRADWRLEYADALRALGIRREALQQIRQARRLCGDCPDALRGESNHHLAFGDAAAAIEPLAALQALRPTPQVRQLLARSLSAAGQAAAVQALLDTVPATTLTVDEAMALARADRRQGTASRSVALATGARPTPAGELPPEFWALAAETCQAAGEPSAALTAIDRALAADPDRALFHHNRAAILVALGREEEARRALDRAHRLDPRLQEDPR